MADVPPEILAARERMRAKFASANVQTGGKGSVRRKKPASHKPAAGDDKRLQSTLKRMGVSNIPAVEEVNMFKTDGTVIHFDKPMVQAAVAANTYVVSGNGQTKSLQELLPSILSQLGPDNLEDLRKIAESFAKQGGAAPGAAQAQDEDDMPALEGTFEDTEESS